VIDHDDSDVSAGPGEFPAPSCLTNELFRMAFWLYWNRAIRRRSISGCHDRLRSMTPCRNSFTDLGMMIIATCFIHEMYVVRDSLL
jgi:hypothetical protein